MIIKEYIVEKTEVTIHLIDGHEIKGRITRFNGSLSLLL